MSSSRKRLSRSYESEGRARSTSTRLRRARGSLARRSTGAIATARRSSERRLADFSQAPLPRSELPLEDRLRWELEQVHDLVEEQLGRGAIAAVLTDSDPTFSKALRAYWSAGSRLQHEIAADVEAGHLRKGTDAASLGTLLFGAYLGELLPHGRPRPGWADAIVDLLVRGLPGGASADSGEREPTSSPFSQKQGRSCELPPRSAFCVSGRPRLGSVLFGRGKVPPPAGVDERHRRIRRRRHT